MYDIFMRWFSLATPSVKQNRLQASITSDVSPKSKQSLNETKAYQLQLNYTKAWNKITELQR